VDGELLTATDSHPMWQTILDKSFSGDLTKADFNTAEVIQQRFNVGQVEVKGDRLLYNGEEMNGTLSKKIVSSIRSKSTYLQVSNFLGYLDNNPSRNSRDQLFQWLDKSGFELTDGGLVVGYKSVMLDANGMRSVNSGVAWVDDVKYYGQQIPQEVGSVVTMPRSEVTDNPAISCSYGLHVGTYEYAQYFAGNAILRVLVDPADVVSVPNDDATKMRVCKYQVDSVCELSYRFGNSSAIQRVEYKDDTLTVIFNNGLSYDYADVPIDLVLDMIAADNGGSPGRFFTEHIRSMV
jgi:hypothetical protein